MTYFEFIAAIWGTLEGFLFTLSALFALYLFLKDPIRRWSFFGYRPTAILALFDPKKKTILLVKRQIKGDKWQFSQGGIYGSDIMAYVENIAERELNLTENFYHILYMLDYGTIRSSRDLKRTQPFLYGYFSLFKSFRGKGYIVSFMEIDLAKNIKKLRKGFGISNIKIISINEALKLFKKQEEKDEAKMKLSAKVLREIDGIIDKRKVERDFD